jgi:hypothetical protein
MKRLFGFSYRWYLLRLVIVATVTVGMSHLFEGTGDGLLVVVFSCLSFLRRGTNQSNPNHDTKACVAVCVINGTPRVPLSRFNGSPA